MPRLHFFYSSLKIWSVLLEYWHLSADIVHNMIKVLFLQKFEKKGKRKVQGVPQSQTAALPRPQEEEKTDKS